MPDFGDGSPRENYGEVDANAPSVSNGMISPEQWAEYKRKRHQQALMGILGTLGGTTALGALGGALGGGGAAAGSAAGSATINGLPMAPYAGTAAMSAPGVGAGAAGGALGTMAGGAAGGEAKGVLGGMDAKDLMALALGLTGTVGGMMSKPNDTAPTSATTDPQMQELIALMSGRLKKSEPMFDSVQAMANGLLPTAYQKGGGGMP